MQRRFLAGALALQAVLVATTALAQETVRIETRGGVDSRIRIAVPPFVAIDPGMASAAGEMVDTLSFDLSFSGLFQILLASQYPPGFRGFSPDITTLNLDEWSATTAEYVVYATVRQEDGKLAAEFRLFDVRSKGQTLGREMRVDQPHLRLAAHKFSEEVIKYLDGTPGIGTSEIVFSSGKTGQKEIFVADYDGANAQQVTRHNSISIKPKVSPDGNKIAYLSYKDRYSFLYVFDRSTGVSVPLSKEVGLNSAPTWSPDGNTLAMTLSKDGNTEIYLRNPDGSNPRRLTNNTNGDTSPVFSPDGRQIAFVSDRIGAAQIFVMNSDGSDQRRLSLQGGASYDPAWSPDGRYIAYVVEKRGEGMEIYAMDAGGANPRQITNSQGNNESPSWSADSRHVIFMSTRGGAPQLWATHAKTGEEIRIPRLNTACEGPSWGPRRQ